MKFTFERKNEETGETTTEQVGIERWVWGVIYKNGQEFHQFDDQGKFHQFKEIEQEKVFMFTMYQPENMTTKRIDIVADGAVKYIHFYRNLVLDGGQIRKKIYVFGWENKRGEQVFNYILPDDRVVQADHDVKNLLDFNL